MGRSWKQRVDEDGLEAATEWMQKRIQAQRDNEEKTCDHCGEPRHNHSEFCDECQELLFISDDETAWQAQQARDAQKASFMRTLTGLLAAHKQGNMEWTTTYLDELNSFVRSDLKLSSADIRWLLDESSTQDYTT